MHVSAGHQHNSTSRTRGANRLRYFDPALCLDVKIAEQGVWVKVGETVDVLELVGVSEIVGVLLFVGELVGTGVPCSGFS